MKRTFSHSIAALSAGLCLRLMFVLKYPADSGDTVLYDQIAGHWLKDHVYAMTVNGQVVPVDLRMPGYPAFLAVIYAITGRIGAASHLWVMLAQVVIDLLTCWVVASLAEKLAGRADKTAFVAALWIAALCPFTANYTAVALTEVFAMFFTASALWWLVVLVQRNSGSELMMRAQNYASGAALRDAAFVIGWIVGIGTLFRPETPLLLAVALVALFFLQRTRYGLNIFLRTAAIMICGCILPLAPWAFRNAITLHEAQILAPKDSNLPGELVPYGFMSWEKTWLYRFRDVYLVPWKLNDEAIQLEDIPARAFDTAEEKQYVGAILDRYNDDLTLTADEDAAFGQIARQRTERHPLRTYLWLPAARAMTMWFTPRIELLPVSGHVFPVRQAWEDDRTDLSVTIGFFALNIIYVGLAIWGAIRLWRSDSSARFAILMLAGFVAVRTAFLTTLETPEPRYVLVCFPVVLALAAQVFARRVGRTA